MPCTYYQTPEEIHEETVGPYKKRINELTQLLCETLHKIEGTPVEYALLTHVDGLDKWWTDHKKLDKKQGRR